ncbi:MAG: C_GCAxxG_C_C family protein [Candidatus Thorarchaeota archaeon]|nr:MAG: C_GCAxxG_C_C family protein [Candidatus Thorarchaeota archaeon]
MRIASAFCGGIGGTGRTFGAVTGAAMSLGLSSGPDESEIGSTLKAKRDAVKTATTDFVQGFSDAWGSTRCSKLRAWTGVR